jgi:hypothetical protein
MPALMLIMASHLFIHVREIICPVVSRWDYMQMFKLQSVVIPGLPGLPGDNGRSSFLIHHKFTHQNAQF